MAFTQAPAPPNGTRPYSAQPAPSRRQLMVVRWQFRARRLASRAARAGSKVAGWRWTPALPGLAGVVLVSIAAGGIVGEQAGFMYGVWAGAGALGLFLLRIDRRLS
jgi:hypothetical protein